MTDIITFEEQWIQRVVDGESQVIHRVRIQGMTHWEESIVPLHVSPVIILGNGSVMGGVPLPTAHQAIEMHGTMSTGTSIVPVKVMM